MLGADPGSELTEAQARSKHAHPRTLIGPFVLTISATGKLVLLGGSFMKCKIMISDILSELCALGDAA